MKSLQGLILYHLQGATCSTAIIGMDGTATIDRVGKKGSGGEVERERWLGWRERETGKQVGGRTKNRDVGVSNSCKWWHSVCCNKSSRTKINKKIYILKKRREKKRQLQVSSDRALSIQPLVCASLGAFQDLDSTSSLHPPAVSNLPMC